MTHRASMLMRVLGTAVRHPRTTLLLAAFGAVLGVLGAQRIHPTGSISTMLPANDPAAAALARITREFGVLDNLIVLATVTDQNLSEPERIDRLRNFAEHLEQSIRNGDESHQLCSAVSYRDTPELRDFIEREMVPAGLFYLDANTLVRLRERVSTAGIRRQIRENEELISAPGAAGHTLSKIILRDPLRLHQMLVDAARSRFNQAAPLEAGGLTLSRDGSTLMIRLTGKGPASDLEFSKQFVRVIAAACERLNANNLKLEYTGAYAIAVEAERSIRADMIRSITMSLVMLGILFLLAYRSVFSFPIAIVPVAWGILCAFGLSSFYSTELTPVVAVMGAVLAGLAIDYSIHFLTHYGGDFGAGLSTTDTLTATLATVGPPMTVACATSMVGFLTDFFSNVPALRQLALIGALGLGCSLCAALTLLPALLSQLPSFSARMGRARTGSRLLSSLLTALDARSFFSIAAACTVLLALLAAFAVSPRRGSRFETDLTVMHPQPNPPLDAQRTIAERFGQDPDALIVHLQSDSALNLLRLAHHVDRRLRTEEVIKTGVTGSFGPATLLPDPDQITSLHESARELDAGRIVSDFEAATDNSAFDLQAYRDYIGFLREFFGRKEAPNMATLLRFPAVARVMLPSAAVRLESAPTDAITFLFMDRPLDSRAARDGAISVVREALAGLTGVTLTGIAVVSHDTEMLMRSELRRLLFVAIGGVALCSFAYFRQLFDTALSLLPALFGVGCLLGLMDLVDLRLNMINLVGIPLSLGLGVDGGVFLVSLAAVHRRQGGTRHVLMERIGVGCHAIVITTITTVISFGTLVFTSTPAIRSLGEMMAIGTSACLIGTVFLLAPILLCRSGPRAAPPRVVVAP